MRRTFLILSLTGLTLLAGASDAFAQYGLFGLRSRPLVTVDLGDGGYYSPFGYYGGPGYGPNYRGYRYAPSYFDGTPGYPYYPAPAPLAPATQIRRSYYPAPEVVEIRYRIHAGRFVVDVRDQGPGFNPSQVPDPTAPENLERSCGRGLLLIRHYAAWVRHNQEGNCVTFCIWNSQRPAAEQMAEPQRTAGRLTPCTT